MAITNNKDINTIDMKYDYVLSLGELENRTPITFPVKFKTYHTNADEPENVFVCWPTEYIDTKIMTVQLFKIISPFKAKNYLAFFGEDVVSKALKKVKLRDLVTTKDIPYDNLEWMLKVTLGVMVGNKRKQVTVKQNKGAWVKEEKTSGYTILALSQYHTWEKDFLRTCLLMRFPYLAEFNFDCYDLSMGDISEIYIKCPTIYNRQKKEISLYCPIKAFIDNNYDIIRQRHVSYHEEYYKWPGGWGKEVTEEQVQEWRECHVKVVASKTALKLRKYLKQAAYDKAHDIPLVYVPTTVEAKEALHKADTNIKSVPIKYNQRFIIYGQVNGMTVKPIICREFEEGEKILTTIFSTLNAGMRELKDMYYHEIISSYPDVFSVNYETGTVTMIQNVPNNCFSYTMEIVDIK